MTASRTALRPARRPVAAEPKRGLGDGLWPLLSARTAEAYRDQRGSPLSGRRQRPSGLCPDEHADLLEEAAKFRRFLDNLRQTDDGSSARVRALLRWSDGYVSGLRRKCAASAVDHDLEQWGLFTLSE
jgi:hypothetical protein